MINQILITNSTFYNVSRVIMHSATNSEKLLISDCTFNDIIASGRYLVDYSTAFGVQDFVLRNNIFGATKNAGAKGVRANTTPIVDNCYSTSDWELGSNRISGLESYGSASTNLFTDPAKGNFKIKDQQFRGRDNAGDPKWRIEY